MELHSTVVPPTLETVTKFSHTTFTPGGCAPQTSRALAQLHVPTAILSLIGNDPHGNTLRDTLHAEGIDTSGLLASPDCTSLAVLPLYIDGRRGCFVTLGANLTVCVDTILPSFISETLFTHALRVFHFGYPHLTPRIQGNNLRQLLRTVREIAPKVLLTLDVNGADRKDTEDDPVLIPALTLTSAIHANLEEACTITGLAPPSAYAKLTAAEIQPIAEWFTERGAGIACITCGKDGAFVATSQRTDFTNLRLSQRLERGKFLHRPAYVVSKGIQVNASGAGDAFVAGMISELANSAGESGIERIVDAGLASALHRIDRSIMKGKAAVDSLLKTLKDRDRIPPRDTLLVPHLSPA